MTDIFVDADGCPVKQEACNVAKRYGLKVCLVANSRMRFAQEASVELVVVSKQFDAVDNWIVEHVAANDIVISADIPLASRCLKKSARVVDPRGHIFTDDDIVESLANRELMTYLRDMGIMTGGPAPFEKKDRSRFLQALDDTIRAALRGDREAP